MVSEEFKREKFDALKFVMAERLPHDLWNRSQKKTGLVVVATKITSVPRDIVIPVKGSPIELIKELSQYEGITHEKVDNLIKQLRELKIQEKTKEGE